MKWESRPHPITYGPIEAPLSAESIASMSPGVGPVVLDMVVEVGGDGTRGCPCARASCVACAGDGTVVGTVVGTGVVTGVGGDSNAGGDARAGARMKLRPSPE